MSVQIGVRRNEGETWRECAIRHCAEYGLQDEVLEEFDRQVASGIDEATACWGALWDWDCLGFIQVDDEAAPAPEKP